MPAIPTNSRRGQILDNLVRQLQTITIANGYSRDVTEVTTFVRIWSQVPEANSPTIFVVDEDTQFVNHPGKLIEVTWNVGLYIVMKNQTQDDLEEFISDIEVCLTKNTTLGFTDTGRVLTQIRLKNIITDNQFFSQLENSQLAKMTISLLYTKCYGDR